MKQETDKIEWNQSRSGTRERQSIKQKFRNKNKNKIEKKCCEVICIISKIEPNRLGCTQFVASWNVVAKIVMTTWRRNKEKVGKRVNYCHLMLDCRNTMVSIQIVQINTKIFSQFGWHRRCARIAQRWNLFHVGYCDVAVQNRSFMSQNKINFMIFDFFGLEFRNKKATKPRHAKAKAQHKSKQWT